MRDEIWVTQDLDRRSTKRLTRARLLQLPLGRVRGDSKSEAPTATTHR